MAISQWSTSAANNASGVTNINWSEGQAPSTVNNSARQEMADLADWYRNDAEWIDRDDAISFSSGTKVLLTSQDVTAIYNVGRRIQVTASTPGTLFGLITASSTSGSDTALTIDWDSTAVLVSESISDVAIGIISSSSDRKSLDAQKDVITTRGDVVIGSTAGAAIRLAVGTANQVIVSNGTDPAWGAISTATTTAVGTIEIATDAEFQTGTDTGRAVTPASVKNSLGFSDLFTSAEQTVTAAGTLTLAHGLGRKPIMWEFYGINKTAEFGYSIGDEIILPQLHNTTNGTGYGVIATPDATNMNIKFTNGGFGGYNNTNGAFAIFTDASWKLVVRAWG